jgi:hypothetical protein
MSTDISLSVVDVPVSSPKKRNVVLNFGALCGYFCASVFVLALAIPVLYFGFADEDATCQHGTRGGLTLSDWNKGAGLSLVIITALIPIGAVLAVLTDNDGFVAALMAVLGADVLFSIVWWVYGVVVLATVENSACVAEGKGMAVTAIIYLAMSWIRFSYFSVVGLLISD